jgi:hypothetical protein
VKPKAEDRGIVEGEGCSGRKNRWGGADLSFESLQRGKEEKGEQGKKGAEEAGRGPGERIHGGWGQAWSRAAIESPWRGRGEDGFPTGGNPEWIWG